MADGTAKYAPPENSAVDPVDFETAGAEAKPELRLWLRLLTCTTMIEAEIRQRLRAEFGVTLPRFDLLAQLDKAPDGMTMSALSQHLMVTNGNVTGLVERLVAEDLVTRTPDPQDRRSQIVALTRIGRRSFEAMAAAHEGWVSDLFDGLDPAETAQLMRLLTVTKRSVGATIGRTATKKARNVPR
ncbi:MAG TPA: MarR family transcriptional regulator [Stellaceae bacterium]|nr:MarR family transcriptional regulator [Stellaceae bacterium]